MGKYSFTTQDAEEVDYLSIIQQQNQRIKVCEQDIKELKQLIQKLLLQNQQSIPSNLFISDKIQNHQQSLIQNQSEQLKDQPQESSDLFVENNNIFSNNLPQQNQGLIFSQIKQYPDIFSISHNQSQQQSNLLDNKVIQQNHQQEQLEKLNNDSVLFGDPSSYLNDQIINVQNNPFNKLSKNNPLSQESDQISDHQQMEGENSNEEKIESQSQQQSLIHEILDDHDTQQQQPLYINLDSPKKTSQDEEDKISL